VLTPAQLGAVGAVAVVAFAGAYLVTHDGGGGAKAETAKAPALKAPEPLKLEAATPSVKSLPATTKLPNLIPKPTGGGGGGGGGGNGGGGTVQPPAHTPVPTPRPPAPTPGPGGGD
jgi:hypothetical protein